MGEIGQRVASIALAFGMDIQYFSTSGTSHYKRYPSVNLDTLLTTSDIITIHAPLNDTTKNLLNYTSLSKMKSTAYLINMGRGAIVNENDLVDALNDNLIEAAAIDVYVDEPIKTNHPYLNKLNNTSKLYLTPHIAWASREARSILMNKVASNIRNFIKKK